MRANKLCLFIAFTILILSACNNRAANSGENNYSLASDISLKEDRQTNTLPKDECVGNSNLERVNDLGFDSYVGSYLIEKNEMFQSVYSSQNYGTFYQIFCRANFYKHNSEEYIDSFEFRILNFKGPLNIGFAASTNEKNELKFRDSIVALKAVVRGASQCNTLKINVRKDSIKKGAVKKLNIYRVLLHLNEDNLPTSSNGIFDDEFYSRSGIGTEEKRKLVPGLEGYPHDSINGFKWETLLSDDLLKNFGDSLNCYSSSIVVE